MIENRIHEINDLILDTMPNQIPDMKNEQMIMIQEGQHENQIREMFWIHEIWEKLILSI